MDVSENSGTPKSSILIGFSIINHPFWGTPIFGNTHINKGVFPLSCYFSGGVEIFCRSVGMQQIQDLKAMLGDKLTS